MFQFTRHIWKFGSNVQKTLLRAGVRYSITETGDAETGPEHRGGRKSSHSRFVAFSWTRWEFKEEQVLKKGALGPNETPEEGRYRSWLLER